MLRFLRCSAMPASRRMMWLKGRPFSSGGAVVYKAADLQTEIKPNCVQRIKDVMKKRGNDNLKLKIWVQGGDGCEGFAYHFDFIEDVDPNEGDKIYDCDGAKIVVDDSTAQLLKGAVVDYVTEMIGSSIRVVHNPNAKSSCGCGSSFSPKE